MSAPTTWRSAARAAIAAIVSSRVYSRQCATRLEKNSSCRTSSRAIRSTSPARTGSSSTRGQVAAEDGMGALGERHVHQGFDLRVRVAAVALHHVLDARLLVGGRVDLPGHHQVFAQRDGVQVLLCGPPAQPATPPLLENEVLDELAVMGGQVVLEQQQDLAGVRDGLGSVAGTGPSRVRRGRRSSHRGRTARSRGRTRGPRCRGGGPCWRSTTGSSSRVSALGTGFCAMG